MGDRSEHAQLPAGATVIDTDGDPVGTVRAVYPHYVAVEGGDSPPTAYRVPFRAIFAVDGTTVTLNVQKDALDPLSPEEATFGDDPHHGGAMPAGTGTDAPEAAAGFTFGGRMIGDGEPGDRPPDEVARLEDALARYTGGAPRATEAGDDQDPADTDTGAAYGTDSGN